MPASPSAAGALAVAGALAAARAVRNLRSTTAGLRSSGFTDLPLRPEIGDRARAAQAMLARRSQHRAAGIMDLLTAAIAEHHRAIVLHHDSDFDHIAAVSGQQTEWIIPCGTAS